MADTELTTLHPAAVTETREIGAGASSEPAWKRMGEHASWPTLSQLTVAMTAGIVLKGFKVRDLLALDPGQVIESGFQETEDVPLRAGQLQVAWSEFEVVEQRLMIRLTRLA